jgi:hypothetical protein
MKKSPCIEKCGVFYCNFKFNLCFIMKKQGSANRVKHDIKSTSVYALLIWLYDFRTKYNFSESSLYDIIFVYYYNSVTFQGISATQLMLKRYGQRTSYVALRYRLDTLIKRGLIYRLNRKLYPSELLLKEMSSLELPEVLIKCVLATAA